MNTADTIPLLLLAVLGICIGMGLALLAWVMALRRRSMRQREQDAFLVEFAPRTPAGERPNLWLAVPNDSGVFQGAVENDGIRCVHPVQVYLDLKEHPERSAEAADRLRTELLTWSRDG